MTEAEWFTVADWHQHFQYLGDTVSPRKLRLLAAGFCRLVWDRFEDAECREAVETAERYADGRATVQELEECRQPCRVIAVQARDLANRLISDANPEPRLRQEIRSDLAWAAAAVLGGQLEIDKIGSRVAHTESLEEQRSVLFDLFGNPFRPVLFDPSWRTSTVLALARPMLDRGDFTAMPILADALQDAGCEDEQVLEHCREGCPHFRGCWVVDGLLGKT